jgi:hypothetical protein
MKKILVLVLLALLPFAAAGAERSIDGTSVTITVSPEAGTNAYAVEELLPVGLTPSDMSYDGLWDQNNKKVKWGPFFDDNERILQYKVSGASGNYTITGVWSFDGNSINISGESLVQTVGAQSGFLGLNLSAVNTTNLSNKFQNVTHTGVQPVDDLTNFLISVSPFLLLIIGLIIFFLAGFAKIIAIVLIVLALIRIAWMIFFGG